ncbi:MAG: hypothetical protein VX809_04755, partial [Pseudomonadota bacterium]|nr:hypothetical protein [Pseudomonadota bacterium]
DNACNRNSSLHRLADKDSFVDATAKLDDGDVCIPISALHTGGAPGWYIHGSFDAAYSCDVRHRMDPDNASFISMVAGSWLFQVVVETPV